MLAVLPAASSQIYGIFLLALFVLASGITVLQVSANPYVTALGDPKNCLVTTHHDPKHLTLFGTTVAPFFGSYLIYGATGEHGGGTPSASDVQVPYLILAAITASSGSYFHVLKDCRS